MDSDDVELLSQYVVNGCERAFAELVRRYLDLVYSAALRQVRSPQLAEEVAQSVFVDLSRSASRIKRGTPVVAWLSTVTRRTAIDVVRHESRRRTREQAALEIAAMKSSPSVWSQVEPLLDEAIEGLKESDRTALLLRFFENKSLREIGERLGTSEDTAQKRVSRAIEHLRLTFMRRGIALTSAGLTADISAHAVQVAPHTLRTAIATATDTLGKAALAKATTLELGRSLAMTTFQKTILAVAAAATVGVTVFQVREMLFSRQSLQAAERSLDSASADLLRLKQQRDAAAAKLQAAERGLDRGLDAVARKAEDARLEAEMRAWMSRAEQLRQLRVDRPELSSPELELLDADDWFSIAKDAQLDTDSQVRDAFKKLRNRAENVIAERIRSALGAFLEGNAGQAPTNIVQLIPFFDPPLNAAILDRYEVIAAQKSDAQIFGENLVIATKYPIDPERDSYWRISPKGAMSIGSFLQTDISNARKAFALANAGKSAKDPAELLPYMKWPVPIETLKKHFGEGRRP